jgi:outer membrane biosynthesis protein TonB
MTPLPLNQIDSPWSLPARNDWVFTIRINRHIVMTLLLSILLHLALLWFFAPKLFSIGAPVKDAPPLQITLGPPQKEEVAPSEEVLPTPEIIQEKQAKPPKTKVIEAKPPKQAKAIKTPVEVVKESDVVVQKSEKLNKTLPQPVSPEVSSDPLPGEDMQAYVKRIQQAKLAKKGLSKQDVEAVMASNNPQSEGEKRDAKIKANLDLDGTNGIFEIRYLGPHNAQFSFKGWKNNINTARLEIIEVDAPNGVNIKSAVINRMIEIIRRDYDGDFNWDSHRLHRVIALSARVEDTEALQSFMMLEFFGPGSQYH